MTFKVAYGVTLYDILCFSMQGEVLFVCANCKCHLFTFEYARGRDA